MQDKSKSPNLSRPKTLSEKDKQRTKDPNTQVLAHGPDLKYSPVLSKCSKPVVKQNKTANNHPKNRPATSQTQRSSLNKVKSKSNSPEKLSKARGNLSPSQSLIKYERIDTTMPTPGPADYEIERGKSKSPVCIIGSSPRCTFDHLLKEKREIPGPGEYNIEINGHSPSAIIIGRKIEKVSMMPGPGDYDISKAKNYSKAAEYSLPKSSRPDVVRNNYPGPSDYQTTKKDKATLGSFGKSSKGLTFGNDSPGPDFSPLSSLSHRGGVIGIKTARRESESPGPGHYSIREDSPKRCYSFTKASKVLKNKEYSVSPASYSPSFNKTQLFTKFPRSARHNLFSTKPNEILNLLSKSISSLNKDMKIDLVPGPGTYELKSDNDSPKFSIPKSSRETKVTDTPGPGEYSPSPLISIPSYKFGTSSKPAAYVQEPKSSITVLIQKLEDSAIRKNYYSDLN